MEELQELLSLATFEPDKAYEPYLNTPRSLEACRLNGVNPIELVEIPIGEFQKDFPNDPDAVQRRFERVDGARRRMLQYVMNDWKDLCASGWAPPRERPKSAKETIVQVSAGAHCTLLELQAQRFRKIEKDNWDALNRQLQLELRQADMEQKNKKIVQKHKEIENQNDNVKKERMLMLEQLHREEMERQKRKDAEEAEEVRKLQEMDRELARKKRENDEINRQKEKQNRERREADRVQREQYTKQLKTSIMAGLENKVEQKKRVLDIRDKNMEDRVEQTRRERERMLEQRRLEKEERLRKAREDQIRQDEEDRAEMLARIAQNQEKRQRLQEQRDRERREMNDKNEDASKEKLAKIKATTDGVVNGKANRTQAAMQYKDELARQELKRVKEAQEKRKCIKAIRQEAFVMASHRARKAQEYKMMRLAAELKNKDDRCAAIKKGFFALDHMRNSMKDIMEKTNAELKHEMHQLRHKDNFDPDEVMRKALQVGNTVLFPRLERTFGISDSPFGKSGALQGGGANIFPSEFGNTTATAAGASGGGAAPRPKTSSTLMGDPFAPGGGGEGDLNATGGLNGTQRDEHTGKLTGKAAAGAGAATLKGHSKSSSRMGFEPLHIQSMSQDRLQQAMAASKLRLENGSASVGKDSSRLKKTHTNAFFEDDGRYGGYADEGDEDEAGPKAILKLPEDDPQYGHSSHAAGKATNRGGHSKGLSRSLSSPASSQASVSVTQLLPLSPDSHKQGGSFKDNGRNLSPLGKEKKVKISSGTEAGSTKRTRARPNSAEDVKLPMFKFDPLRPSEVSRGEALPPNETGEGEEAGEDGQQRRASSRPESPSQQQQTAAAGASSPAARSNSMPLSLSRKLNSMADIRTDVNDRAKYLEPPPGKFRREFSNDHPLAKNGTGKYTAELKNGVTPAGMHVEVPEKLKNTSVSDTIEVADKIERLTYTAQRRVVDPKQQIEELKKQQNATLKRIIIGERDAEAAREATLRSVADPKERQNLESVFSEERRRASDRIIAATRSHEEAMRQMVLNMMDLGAGTPGYGKEETRLPMANFFQ